MQHGMVKKPTIISIQPWRPYQSQVPYQLPININTKLDLIKVINNATSTVSRNDTSTAPTLQIPASQNLTTASSVHGTKRITNINVNDVSSQCITAEWANTKSRAHQTSPIEKRHLMQQNNRNFHKSRKDEKR